MPVAGNQQEDRIRQLCLRHLATAEMASHSITAGLVICIFVAGKPGYANSQGAAFYA
jgi:hypothetical protein